MSFLDNALTANGIRLTESSSYMTSGSDPDRDSLMKDGFRKLTKSQNERDLMPLEQERMIEIALFLYDSNPLAKRIIDLVNSYVTGDGFSFNAKHPKVLSVLKKFWEDPVNDWPLKQLERFKMLSLCGEVLWPVAVRRTDGRVQMGYIDPANIEEIIPDPWNAEIPRTAVIKAGHHVDGTELPRYYSLVNVDDRQNAFDTYGKLNYYPHEHGAFYFAVNKPPNATRGRSDLITVFDWLDLYDQLLFGSSERATYLTDFVWDVTIKGADKEALNDWHRDNPLPRGAAMRVHNENVNWNAIAPNLNAGDTEMMARLIKQHILTALGIPPAWISDPGDTNRSTGVVMAGPVLKTLSHRQRFCRAILTRIMQFAIDQAVIAGTLAGLTPEQLSFDVLAPSLTPSDMSAMTMTVIKLAQALQLAERQEWISHETTAKTFLKTITELGVQLSIEDEMTKMKELARKHEAELAAKQAAMAAGPPPEPGAPGAPPGPPPMAPRDQTGSPLQSPIDQTANQLASRSMEGSTTTRKGNPAG